ncbi:MAG TPA: MetQ/NlpA family ABC transporter substrate-binding protein [Pseudogracilibacillus sp.]|nr:MetQ/NlpA family ABC transporter substrate-binding protein [Pseudogracilibacillus sp.]
MKKILTLVSLSFILVLAACGGNDNEGAAANDDDTIVIGASSVPHGEILEEAEPLLEEEGIELEIEPYEDFVLPNDDLDSGEIDANFFQHIPYLEQTNEDSGYNLVNIGGIHIEPMGVYSQGFDSVDDVPDGTEVVLSNSVADHGRVLSLFEEEGLIELDDSVDPDEATIDDIDENPHNLEFTADNEAGFLPDIYESEEDALVVINTNYAIEAGLDPQTDTLFKEEDDSPYVNVVAVDEEDEDNEALNTLVDVLHSDEIVDFIEEEYDGAVVPVSE